MTTTGIYIHIPYCISKCAYCDFLSFPAGVDGTQEAYVNALLSEIELASRTRLDGVLIDTVYIGGGTPTALTSPLLCKILQKIGGLRLISGAEITVEANPGTLTPEYLAALKSSGVNRLSIGLQTTQPRLLHAINRIHTYEEFLQNFQAAREAGFSNINIDLMFALPRQTQEDWQETLAEIVALSPEHISAYSLTPAENTPLWDALESNTMHLPSEETDRNMYRTAKEILSMAGYTHYEISNFAKPDKESRHNVNCWKRVPYLGFGLGAHSLGNAGGSVSRWNNTETMQEYVQAPTNAGKNITPLSKQDQMAEAMILGLRLTEGVSEQGFAAEFGITPTESYKEIPPLISGGLLVRGNGYLRLTPKGLDLANQVFTAFL